MNEKFISRRLKCIVAVLVPICMFIIGGLTRDNWILKMDFHEVRLISSRIGFLVQNVAKIARSERNPVPQCEIRVEHFAMLMF